METLQRCNLFFGGAGAFFVCVCDICGVHGINTVTVADFKLPMMVTSPDTITQPQRAGVHKHWHTPMGSVSSARTNRWDHREAGAAHLALPGAGSEVCVVMVMGV